MKKVTPAIALLMIIFVSSCKKENSISNAWTFKGTTFTADSAAYNNTGGGAAYAKCNQGELVVYFGNGLPTTTITYTVANGKNSLAASNVYVGLSTATADYYSTGTHGNQTVNVNVASNGKVTVSGTNIEVINTTQPTDSSSLNFNFSLTR